MSPPRRPKGEKPATTIRFLRRQINNIQTELAICRQAMTDRDKTIAQQDVFLSEAEDRERILTKQVEDSADDFGTLLAETQTQRFRLAYLEGYHAKSTETLPGAGPGNPSPHRDSETGSETGRQENLAERLASQGRREIWSIPSDDPAHHNRRPMGERPIAGPARDATSSDMARHRR